MLENLILSEDIVHEIQHMDKNVIDLNDYTENKLMAAFKKALQKDIFNKLLAKLQKEMNPNEANKMN